MKHEDMSKLRGVYINPVERRYEWNPFNLTENIFMIIGSLNRQMKTKVVDSVEDHPDLDGWFIWRWI